MCVVYTLNFVQIASVIYTTTIVSLATVVNMSSVLCTASVVVAEVYKAKMVYTANIF